MTLTVGTGQRVERYRPLHARNRLAHRPRLRRLLPDLAAAAAYLVAAVVISGGLWLNLDSRTPAVNPQDHAFFQWALAHAARVVTDGVNPFVTDRMNVPHGVNLMANTSVLGLGVPLTPVTLLFGPQTSFAVLLVLGLAGTAAAWYWLFSRHLVGSRAVAFVAGAFCGFAPGLVSHVQGHVNWITQLLVPILVLRTLRLREPGRVVRNGVVLGVLIAYQAFINEEVLLYAALAGSVFLGTYAAFAWPTVRPGARTFATGLAIAAAVAAVVLAYPLWVQFFGPQSYRGVPDGVRDIGSDLASYPAFARLSLAGDASSAARVAQGPAEENTFFGWPLLLLAAFGAAWMWRSFVVRAALVTGVVFAALSLGPELVVGGHRTGIPGPWLYLGHLPLLDAVVPTRFGLVLVPILAVLVALPLDRLRTAGRLRVGGVPVRPLGYAAVAAAMIPLVPAPFPVKPTPPAPEFVTAGRWREYVPPGRSIVFVPLSNDRYLSGMRFAARSRLEFAIAGGYFLGPGGDEGRAIFGAPPRRTQELLQLVARTGYVPRSTSPELRKVVADDLAYWRAAVLVIPSGQPHEVALRRLLDGVVGPGERVGGVWLWDVRNGIGTPSTGRPG
ncbi:MAG TPA: hypothetical protein VGJ53_05495 [Micromonosporaceae bacterium]